MLTNQISPLAFHKWKIKTVWFFICRIIRSVSCIANTEAIFLDDVTRYTETRILFWDCRLDLFFLSPGWIVKSVYPLSWELQRRQADLTQHLGCTRLIHQSEVSVGEETSLQFNFCTDLEWKLQKSAKILTVFQVTSPDLLGFSSEVSTSGLFINSWATSKCMVYFLFFFFFRTKHDEKCLAKSVFHCWRPW